MQRALASRRFGPYTLQAAIAAVHAEAPTAADTDWGQIVGLYEVLLRIEPSPVVELNRAAAVAMRDGPAAGLALVDAILARGDLAQYYLAHSARADLCRRLGRTDEARASYRRALELTRQEPERRFLERRLRELGGRAGQSRLNTGVPLGGRDIARRAAGYGARQQSREVGRRHLPLLPPAADHAALAITHHLEGDVSIDLGRRTS